MGDINRKGTCLAAWETACKSKDEGGLGIIDIKTQNNALLLKFLDKFYRKSDIPWVQVTWSKIYDSHQTPPHLRSPVGLFWWKDIIKLFNLFQQVAVYKPNMGDTFALWSEAWLGHDQILKDMYPELFSFCRKVNCSLKYFIEEDMSHFFRLPLPQEAANQLLLIETHINNTDMDEQQIDVWSYCWGSSIYSSKKTYKILQGHIQASPLFKWLWGASNLGKHLFFFWLLLRDRLNTRNLLRRKNRLLEDYSCVLCNSNQEETLLHLFFECPFSIACWTSIGIQWNSNLQPLDMLLAARQAFGSKIFREIIITATWVIWLVWNGVIFDNEQAT